ncbi:MAG: hypothetical protein AAGJ46_00560 [Planctomycetota bacterium]
MTLRRRLARLLLTLPILTPLATGAAAADSPLRIVGPDSLPPGVPALVRIEERVGDGWRLVDPDELKVEITGGEKLPDPAALEMNPVTLLAESGSVTVAASRGSHSATATLDVGPPETAGTVLIDLGRKLTPSHRFDGFGGGVLFYDNQWELSRGDEFWDWCFRDVRATFLHILARPRYEPENDNNDWRVLDADRMDFSVSQRAISVAKKALEKDPELKIYLSLYSPPAWMKANNQTRGDAGLKPGVDYRQELAEYFFAYLKELQAAGIEVSYLAFFNEPDWPHEQDGMLINDLGELADTFDQVAAALEELIEADGALTMPALVFPDALGAGALTRSPRGTPELLKRKALLRRRVGVWGVHDYWNQPGYWPGRFKELRRFPPVGKKPIWMTEWAQRYRLGDLESANEYGANILNALRLGAQAWMVFEWCHPSGNQSGLISCDWNARPPRQRYWRSKAYYVFQQLANTTPAESTILRSTARGRGVTIDPRANQSQLLEHLALLDGETLVLHAHNRGPNPIQVEMKWPGEAKPSLEALETGPTGNRKQSDGLRLEVGRGRSKIVHTLAANTLLSVRVESKE